jgi:anti-sigma factor RsiW
MEPTVTRPLELSCEQCRELLSGYVDHELSGEERGAVEHHLATCPRCATESTSLVGLKNVVRHWDGIQGSQEFHQEVLQELVRESQMLPSKQFTDAADKARAESLRKTPPEPSGIGKWVWLIVLSALIGALAGAVAFYLVGR